MTNLSDILYVEDDPDIQAVACMALQSVGGFRVVPCDSGARAIESVNRGGERATGADQRLA